MHFSIPSIVIDLINQKFGKKFGCLLQILLFLGFIFVAIVMFLFNIFNAVTKESMFVQIDCDKSQNICYVKSLTFADMLSAVKEQNKDAIEQKLKDKSETFMLSDLKSFRCNKDFVEETVSSNSSINQSGETVKMKEVYDAYIVLKTAEEIKLQRCDSEASCKQIGENIKNKVINLPKSGLTTIYATESNEKKVSL